MSGSFDAQGRLDISDGRIITCFGKKKSGKSVLGLLLFRSYPWDRVVIDVAGDDGPIGTNVVDLRGTLETLPSKLPEETRDPAHGRPYLTWRYAPDAGSDTFLEDMDHVVGLALAQGKRSGHCCLLIHEGGVLAQANRTPRNTRRALMHNRHNGLTMIMCQPRAMGIDMLIVAQSDLVYTFDVPQGSDRNRIAENLGWPAREFDEAWRQLARHEYLRYDANQPRPSGDEIDYRLMHFPPLPQDVVDSTLKWSKAA
jgi:hypothetical protein